MEHILKSYCSPCKPGTTEIIGKCFLPNFDEFEWVVDKSALNGWVFQNHFDCVSAGIAGAINSVMGFNRENPLVSARDISSYISVQEEKKFYSIFDKINEENPQSDLSELVHFLVSNLLFSIIILIYYKKKKQPSPSAFNKNEEDLDDWRTSLNKDLVHILDKYDIDSMIFSYEKIRKLKKVQVETSNYNFHEVFKNLPFGLSAYSVHEYTWIDLKNYLKMDNVAVLVRLPSHLALVFATGENLQTGKLRHVLVGRPGGGQSPSGWIPWNIKDKHEDETCWSDDIMLAGGLTSETNHGLTMYVTSKKDSALHHYFICQRELIIVKRENNFNIVEKELQDLHSNLTMPTSMDNHLNLKWHRDLHVPMKQCSKCINVNSIVNSFLSNKNY